VPELSAARIASELIPPQPFGGRLWRCTVRIETEGVISLQDLRASYWLELKTLRRKDPPTGWALLYRTLLGLTFLALGIWALLAVKESQNWQELVVTLTIGGCFTPFGLLVLVPQAFQVLVGYFYLYLMVPLFVTDKKGANQVWFVISDEGLAVGLRPEQVILPWEKFNGYVESRDVFLLSLAQDVEEREVIFIPRHFFSELQAKEFSDFLRKRFP
jgi:hypothetical protein